MNSNDRACRISLELAGTSADSNGPQTGQNTSSGIGNALQMCLQANLPTNEDVFVKLQGKDLGVGMEKVEDCRQALIKKVIDPFSSPTGTNVSAIIKQWDPTVASNLYQALPEKAKVKRSDSYPNKVVAKCMLNLYYVMAPIDEAIRNDRILLCTQLQQEFGNLSLLNQFRFGLALQKALPKTQKKLKLQSFF